MYEVTDGKNTFAIHCDKANLLEQAQHLADSFEADTYVAYGTSPEWDDPFFDEAAYLTNVQEFVQDIDRLINEQMAQHLATIMPKKKNGKFAKNRIHEICSCKNCQVLHEWHNTWVYHQVIAKAIDENTLEISIREYTDTPA